MMAKPTTIRRFGIGDRVAIADHHLSRVSPEGADVIKVGRKYLTVRLRDQWRSTARLTLAQVSDLSIPNYAARADWRPI